MKAQARLISAHTAEVICSITESAVGRSLILALMLVATDRHGRWLPNVATDDAHRSITMRFRQRPLFGRSGVSRFPGYGCSGMRITRWARLKPGRLGDQVVRSELQMRMFHEPT